MRTDQLDFELPADLIAQAPLSDRHASRLLHYRRSSRSIAHRVFSDLPSLLRPGDLLVFNDARVIPARFMLRKSTSGLIEGLFLAQGATGEWRALLKNAGGLREGATLNFVAEPETAATLANSLGAGEFTLRIMPAISAGDLLGRVGRMPLPPYIRRDKEKDERDDLDRARYQTVFASAPGAVAAPTAALHFSEETLAALDRAGVERTVVTLQVGMGTFKPVAVDELADHVMHIESYAISVEAAAALNRAKAERRRIVAVGTTSARVLESQPGGEPFVEGKGETGIFIRPGYAWKHVNALVTNFHLPRSTLIALVASLVSLEEQRRIYQVAIAERYRFFSYGDAMFIE